MISTAEDIRDMIDYYFDDVSSSGSSGTDTGLFEISIGKEPSSPTNVITILETPGFPPQLTYNKEERYEYPSIQIRVRSDTYPEGYQQALRIRNILHGRAHETWNASYYSVIYCVNGPLLLDYDKNQRPRFILNFNAQRRALVKED